MRGEHQVASPSARPTQGAVHPRMRGEHTSKHAIRPASQSTGSSPHARGTRAIVLGEGGPSDAKSLRFIPACAGNTALSRCAALDRFIPACAGNTRRAAVTTVAVHPRMRGEHAARRRPRCRGSSPHARGTPGLARRDGISRPVHPRMRGEPSASDRWHVRRFIPACAGNTRSSMPTMQGPVHPRMRGEHAGDQTACRC